MITYRMNETKWNSIQWFFDRLWEDPEAFPDQGVLLALSEKEAQELLSIDRIALLQTLKSAKPTSVSKITQKVGRNMESVLQDLELLQTVFLTEKDEKGNWKAKEVIVVPEIELTIRRLGEKELTVA